MRTITLDEYSRKIAEEAAMAEGWYESKFEVARKMLARKMPISDIIDITGLNEKDLLSL